jgi:hypothetical protein
MQHRPKRAEGQVRHHAEREEMQTRHRAKPEERQMRLPNQSAPVRRVENPPGPFSPDTAREAICHILSPYAAVKCVAARGLS